MPTRQDPSPAPAGCDVNRPGLVPGLALWVVMPKRSIADPGHSQWSDEKSLHSRDLRVRQIVEAFNAGDRPQLAMLRFLPDSPAGRTTAVKAIARAHQVAKHVVAARGGMSRPAKAVAKALYLLQRIGEIDGLPDAFDTFRVAVGVVKDQKARDVDTFLQDARDSIAMLLSAPAFPFVGGLARELASRRSAKPQAKRGRPADAYRRAFLLTLALRFVRETGDAPPDDASAHSRSRRGKAVFYDIAAAALEDIGEKLQPRTAFDAIRKAVLALDDDDAVGEILAVEAALFRGNPRRLRKKSI